MPTYSYAQNAEDVVLARVFGGATEGRYVDVGAGHPVVDSVTKLFYDLGWRGINIEPLEEEFELLRKERPEDVNLELAVSDRPGTLPIYAGPPENRGSSTLQEDLAESYRSAGQDFVARMVEVATLQSVLDEHGGAEIDFLKVDVEGHERQVLEGVDLTAWRPRVIVVEATRPNSTVRSHEDWEPRLLAAGYLFGLFDGLNRFYVREEDRALLPLLEAPANVLDDFVPHWHTAEVDVLREQLDLAENALAEAQPALEAAHAARADAQRSADSLADRVRELEGEGHRRQDEVAYLTDELTRVERAADAARRVTAEESDRRLAAEQGRADAAEALAAIRATITFRATEAPRRWYGRYRGLAVGRWLRRPGRRR